MPPTNYILWEEQGQWRGYLKDYPDQVAQGKSFEDLQSKLRHLRRDLTGQEHDQPPHNTTVTAPPRVLTPRQIRTRARLEKIFLSMLTNP